MTNDCIGRKYVSKWTRGYDMIVTRRRKLLGFAGLDECVKVGLWTDPSGRRRTTELVRLGTAHSVETALGLAEAGMGLHPAGTRQHRRYADWHRRLRATEWCMVRAEDAYWRKVRAHAGDVPVYIPELVAAE